MGPLCRSSSCWEWVFVVVLVFVFLEGNVGAQSRGNSQVVDLVDLKSYSVILDDVRAKPISDSEGLFSFGFSGKRVEFVLTRKEIGNFEWFYQAVDSTGYKNWLVVVYGGWETPMLRGFLKIDDIIYHVQPSMAFLQEFPELEGTLSTVATPQNVLLDSYYGSGVFDSTVSDKREDRKRSPTAPATDKLTSSQDPPLSEPPQPCPTEANKQMLVIDTVTDGAVYASFAGTIPSSGINAAIEAEVIALINWISDVYEDNFNVVLTSGQITIKTGFDNSGSGWSSGSGTGWNRECTGDRSTWYEDTLNSFSCWVDDQSNLDGALTQLLHGCTWSGGGTVGLAWIGVPCRSSSFIFNDGAQCGGKASVSNYGSSALYLIAAHEMGHNLGLNHDAYGVMIAISGSETEFSKTSQTEFCNHFGGSTGASSCATDAVVDCTCGACGTVCGVSCPNTCSSSQTCVNNVCETSCTPQCGGGSYECGVDGCGGTCGTCGGDQTCNSNMCQNLANGFSDHATLINNERSRWGVSSSVVSSSLSDCVSQSQTCATALSFPSQCIQDEGLSGSSTIFGYTYYANSAFTDYEAIQYHLTNLFTIGDTYSCSTNSFSGGETSAANLYRQYISEDSNMNIGLSVLRDCPSGDDHFMVVVLFNPKLPDNTRPVTSCPSSGASCTPNTCTPTGSCYLHGTPAGCNAGAMDCACSEGQICNEESGFCELCASCMAQEFNCGSVASCSGLTESCGECEGDESCYMKDGETGGVCCSPQSSCDDFCGTLSAEENCGLALECSCSEARVATDSFPVCECDDNQCFPSVAESGCIPNSNCAPCQEGSVCCVLDTDGPTCAPEGSGCVCPGGAVWVNGECTVPTPGVSSSLQAERDCGSVWYEQVGAQSGSGRETFSPSLEDCSIVAKKTDLDCPEGLPYCANLYIFGGFSSSNPGDGVSVEVKGFSEGIAGVFLHGNEFYDEDAISSRYWAGYIDFKNDKIGSGLYTIKQVGEEKTLTSYTKGGITSEGHSFDLDQWYVLTLSRPLISPPGDCLLRLSAAPVNDGVVGERKSKDIVFSCSVAEEMVGDGGEFGLVSNTDARFRNFIIFSSATVTFTVFLPYCPSQDNIKYYVSRLIEHGVQLADITINNIDCGNLFSKKRQAVAAGGIPISFTITSQTAPASALAARFEFLVSAGRAGAIPFDSTVGFTSTPGSAATTTTAPVQAAPTTATVVGSGGGGGGGGGGGSSGGGGGSGGLSGGQIAGIVIGSVAAAAIVAAIAVVMVKKNGEGGSGGRSEGGSQYSSGGGEAEEAGGNKSNKGVPVMNPESHQRRVIENEMTSVTGRTPVTSA